MKDHPIQCPDDLEQFNKFMNKITGGDPDDTEFYEQPRIVAQQQEFTIEDKLEYDRKQRQIQADLNRWTAMWSGK